MPCLALVLESGVTNMTLKRTISGMIGTGSLAHNRREFIAENVDPNRVQLNICYQNENLKEVYKELLGCAILICATVLNLWLEVKYKDFLVKKDFILSIAVFLGALILTK